jgi:hypothetical protein
MSDKIEDEIEEEIIAFPMNIFESILYPQDDEELVKIPIQSAHSSDFCKVVKVHRPVGEVIIMKDPLELRFHVELFSKHAEVWMTKEWSISTAKRIRFRSSQADWMIQYNINKELVEALADGMTAHKFPDDFCTQVATQIAENYRKFDLSEIITKFELDWILDEHHAKYNITKPHANNPSNIKGS